MNPKLIVNQSFNSLQKISNYAKQLCCEPILQKWKMKKIMNNPKLFEDSRTFKSNLNYEYNWLNFEQKKSILKFIAVSDQQIGGLSKGELHYDQIQKCLWLKGNVSYENRNKMIEYPYIEMMMKYPYRLKVGPFHAISVQICSDGKPIQVELEVISLINGPMICYGKILTTAVNQWQIYQLPFRNMIIRGTEQQLKPNHDYFISDMHSHKITDDSVYEMSEMIDNEHMKPSQLQISNIGLRLLGTESFRNVGIRKFNLIHKSGFQKFQIQYRKPFFYKVNNKIINQDKLINWLNDGYQNLNQLNIGIRKYIRK